MAMELFEKGTYMYSLMADYWVLNRKLLSIDAENLMQDDFWEYATKELEAFYQKYKTNYAKNQALGLLKELEERYKIVKEKLKETEKMEKVEKIETSLPLGFGTGVRLQAVTLAVCFFVQKILKPNAFRHTISEGILNLLEGSDAIYGVIVTRHAADRMRERGGLNRKSIQRIANQVYFNGYPIERTKGRLRKWMYKISKSNPSAQNLRIYGDKLYIFFK